MMSLTRFIRFRFILIVLLLVYMGDLGVCVTVSLVSILDKVMTQHCDHLAAQ